MELYFKDPAKCWLEGFPLGNGRIGAMIYGNPDKEILQLNEDTLWSGTPYNGQRGLSPKVIKKARMLCERGNYEEATTVLEEKLTEAEDVQVYLPFGNLHVDILNKNDRENPKNCHITEYERHLELDRAVASEHYRRNGVKFYKTCFISAPSQGLVYQIKADQPFSVQIYFEGGFLKKKQYENNRFELTGICPGRSGFKVGEQNKAENFLFPLETLNQGIHYMGEGTVTIRDGLSSSSQSGIFCENTTAVEIRLVIRTSYRGYDKAYPLQYTDREIKEMLKEDQKKLSSPFENLLEEHIREYSVFYKRTDFRVWEDNKEPKKDLKKRLADFNLGNKDPGLYALMFAFGKYLLISSSRPGTQAANLQGIWSNELIPPWFGDYTVNINTEMNYWMTGSLNLPEMQMPLLDLCKKLAKNGEYTARELFDSEGTACFHNTDLWGKTSPATGKAMWAFWPFGQAWLCRNLFDLYLFTCDRNYLEKIMPILEENVRFCLDQLQETPKGLAVCPATSPENLFYEDCSVAKYSENTLAIVRNLFRDYIQGCQALEIKNDLVEKVSQALKQIIPVKLGSKGQILEWNEEFPEQDIHHRHLSHLYELHPGRGITSHKPDLYKGAKKSLELRQDEGTGWSLAWKVLMWARMENGERAGKILKRLFRVVEPDAEMEIRGGGIYPNLLCAHPPFQIDGNLGYSAAVAELLVQSHGEEIVLFPALLPEWKNGAATGFLARGNIQVDLYWEGKNVRYVLKAQKDTKINLRVGKKKGCSCFLRGNIPYKGTAILERT